MWPEILFGEDPWWLRNGTEPNPAPKQAIPKGANDPTCPYCNPGQRAAGDGSSRTCQPHLRWLLGGGGKA